MPTLGLDIGGANLKAATSDGHAVAKAFPLWKSPDALAVELKLLTGSLPDCNRVAVTMTGELADCFATKAEGVSRILAAVEEFADNKVTSVWATDGQLLPAAAARANWQLVAAGNWHALATWTGRFAPRGVGLLIDIGSTTTDIIPLRDGAPIPSGRTDMDRLLNGELVYTGVRRTPVCAVTQRVELRGRPCPLAAELFATMLDVYLITGDIPPDPNDCDTADGRPATVIHAENRLAHMFCCDRTEISSDELGSIAVDIADQQYCEIRAAVSLVVERRWHGIRPATAILSGSGTFVARKLRADSTLIPLDATVELAQKLSPALSESACAYAVARLTEEGA